jgi:hypothetical protein
VRTVFLGEHFSVVLAFAGRGARATLFEGREKWRTRRHLIDRLCQRS